MSMVNAMDAARYVLGIAAHSAGDSVTASRELAALRQLDRETAEQLAVYMSRRYRSDQGKRPE
jgi:hypothetical protein